MQSIPKVDKYNGLGRPRTAADMDAEYHRLLERDTNPFAFLYASTHPILQSPVLSCLP